MKAVQLSILIPTKDRPQIVENCLQHCLSAINGIAAEIIVVNDSKTQDLKLSFDSSLIKVYANPKSGVASARNFAASKASGEVLLFLDDDMLVFPDNIRKTLELHQLYPKCFINLNWTYPPELYEKISKTNFGRYLVKHGFDSLKGWNKNSTWKDDGIFESKGLTSQYLSCKRSDFIDSGGYNENFPFAGYEDLAFAEKLIQSGVKIYIYPLSVVYHNETDRCELRPWLNRKTRGGVTIRTANELGYKQTLIYYSPFKRFFYGLLLQFKALWFVCYSVVPNKKRFDAAAFLFIDVLLAVHLFDGYMNYKKHLH